MADKAKLLKVAQKHLSKGALDKAIKTFQQLAEVDPKDQRLILRLADIQARAGRKKEAIENYEKVAAGYMRQDFTPKAIAVYKTILRLDPELFSAYEKLAELYKSQGLEAEALSQFENLFQVYERKNDEDKQIQVLQLMADMDPENLGFQVRLGETLAKKGRKKEAAEAFAKAASTLSRRGFHDRASQLFEKITALNPDNTAVRRELCAHYLESGQFNEARAEIEAILAIEPDDPRMVLLLGRILFQLGKKAEAEQQLAKSIQLFLNAGELESVMREFLFVAQSHLRNDEIDEAEAFYRQITNSVPGEVRAIKGLISVAEHRKDRVGQINNLLLLGRTMQQSGDQEGALKAYSKVNELDPLNEEASGYIDGSAPSETSSQLPELQPLGLEDEIPETGLEEIEEVQLLETDDIETGEISSEAGEEEDGDLVEIEMAGEFDLDDVDEELVEIVNDEAAQKVNDEDEVPDLVLEEIGEEGQDLELTSDDMEDALPADASEETVVLEEPESAEEEMSVEELLAEADVYMRYGLADKASESLEKARKLSPDDQRVLDRIETSRSGPVADPMSQPAGGMAEQVPGAAVESDLPAAEHDPFAEDLEEADFYHSQGLDDEAMRIYQSILERDPQHQKASEALAVIEWGAGEKQPGVQVPPEPDAEMAAQFLGETASEPPQTAATQEAEAAGATEPEPTPPLEKQFDGQPTGEIRGKLIVEDSTPEDMGDFLDIADALRSELADDVNMNTAPADANGPVSFEDIFTQFKKGIEETLGDEEYETHYNLGIAYKDMGLYDDAIREFESGARDPALAQDSYSLMAMCFMEKKEYDAAVKAVERAMEISGGDGKPGLWYQMGELREKQKMWAEAVSAYEQVRSSDPSFEGITEAIERVRASIGEAVTEEEPDAPDAGGDMDEMLTDLIREVEEMARESSGETIDDPHKPKKDRISYL